MKGFLSSFVIPPIVFWGLLIAAPFPILYSLSRFFNELNCAKRVEEEFDRIAQKGSLSEATKKNEESLFASLKKPDPHYIDKHIESLTFLLPEIRKLELMVEENPENIGASKRLFFLKGGGNRLLFKEEGIRSGSGLREMEEIQQSPVEMNEEDLKKLLCLIEGITIWPYGPKEGKPQLIVKDFKLSKKQTIAQQHVFLVSLQLIKRECEEAPL